MCLSSGLWGGGLGLWFSVYHPESIIVQRAPALTLYERVFHSTLHTHAHCARYSPSISLWLALHLRTPAGGRTQSPDCALRIPVPHDRRRGCLFFLLVHQAFWAWCRSCKTNPRLPTTKLICLIFHFGAAALIAPMMLLCCSFASASFTSRNPSSLSVVCLNVFWSADPHRLRPHPVTCPRNDLRRTTLDRCCTVPLDFFWLVLSPLYPVPSLPDLPCCRFLETLLVATACSFYFLCQAWQTWACFLAFVQRACYHTGASRCSGVSRNCRCHSFAACTVDVTVCFVSALTSGFSHYSAKPTPCWLHLAYLVKILVSKAAVGVFPATAILNRLLRFHEIFLSLKYFPKINLPASCLSMKSAAHVP